MLVFGDHACDRETRAYLADIGTRLDVAHSPLVTAFIDAGELAQGIADAEFVDRGYDARSPLTDLTMRLLVELARAIDTSWQGKTPVLDQVRARLHDLTRAPLPESIRTKLAEGHAFYAVYPEAYLAAARKSPVVPDHVIGIRSIGCGLAALVAAATGTRLPATVRPIGNPFRREIDVAPELMAEWLDVPNAMFAILDEGPGMSGSSFGAVADLLEAHGVTSSQLLCFPSHLGPLGPAASLRHRDRWARLRRYAVEADELMRDRLQGYLAMRIGLLEEPLIDISAGCWRRWRFTRRSQWPPCWFQQERRKYLAHAGTRTWLARFVGLGHHGERAYALARATSAAGFTPELVGACHGFLVERWLDDASPFDPRAYDRERLLDRVGAYLRFRATRPGGNGASCDDLITMVRRNVTLGISSELAAAITSRMHPVAMTPVQIDGKLHAWEWLVSGDGTLIKTDAYDHHAGHDLIGCQDIAWDVVGAAVELELASDEEQRLVTIVDVDPRRVEFLRPCYLAFQLGRCKLAADSSDSVEAGRWRVAATRYARLLTSCC